jgi:hypothetical protein
MGGLRSWRTMTELNPASDSGPWLAAYTSLGKSIPIPVHVIALGIGRKRLLNASRVAEGLRY